MKQIKMEEQKDGTWTLVVTAPGWLTVAAAKDYDEAMQIADSKIDEGYTVQAIYLDGTCEDV